MNKLIKLTLMVATLSLTVTGCVPSQSSNVYSRDDVGRAQHVRMGTITALRPVKIEGTKTPIGSGAGAVAGGIAASSIGGGRGSYVAAVLGAVAGGLLGAAAEEGLTRAEGVEITVLDDNGQTYAYVQALSEGEVFRVDDRVRILTINGTTRISH
ncbi:MAG: glycine zipper 2TM domain-containing protein [Porticoccaceae bacterium]|jgi:outer membrane lipoprotein SlyB